MRPFCIAGLQLFLSASRDNLPYIQNRVEHTLKVFPWVDMVLLSELAACGPLTSKAQPIPGPSEQAFQAMAKRHGIWMVNGSIFEKSEDKVYNTASVINPAGQVVGRYRKMFPFLPYEIGVEPGQDFLVFEVPEAGRFGLSICYDMWFPESTRTLAAMGAEVILHPSLTTTIDREVELSIARAGAVTNQCYFVDINGVGECGNGRSLFVGPEGDILHQAGHSEEIMPVRLDLDRVSYTREHGLQGLGQPLKSFRDNRVEFPVYQKGFETSYLESLGELELPRSRRTQRC